MRSQASLFEKNFVSRAHAAEVCPVLSEDCALVANRFDSLLGGAGPREKRPRGTVCLVVPNLGHRVAVEIAEILSAIVREATRGDAPTRIDEHRSIKVEAGLVEQISTLLDQLGMPLPI